MAVSQLDDGNTYNECFHESVHCRILFSLVLALVIAAFGYPQGAGWAILSAIYAEPAYYLDVSFSWVMVFLSMEVIYSVGDLIKNPPRIFPQPKHTQFLFGIAAFITSVFFMEFFNGVYVRMTGRALLGLKEAVFQLPLSLILVCLYSLLCYLNYLHAVLIKKNGQNGMKSDQGVSGVHLEEFNPIFLLDNGQTTYFRDQEYALIEHVNGVNFLYPMDGYTGVY